MDVTLWKIFSQLANSSHIFIDYLLLCYDFSSKTTFSPSDPCRQCYALISDTFTSAGCSFHSSDNHSLSLNEFKQEKTFYFINNTITKNFTTFYYLCTLEQCNASEKQSIIKASYSFEFNIDMLINDTLFHNTTLPIPTQTSFTILSTSTSDFNPHISTQSTTSTFEKNIGTRLFLLSTKQIGIFFIVFISIQIQF